LDAFNRLLFDEDRGRYVDGEGSTHVSLHGNMFPLALGLVPPSRLDQVADYVASRGMACSVYGAQYLLEGLYAADRAEAAYALLTDEGTRSWRHMLALGTTITLEAWDNQFKPNQDWNHAWGAAPGNIIPRFIMGVRPLAPGFARVLIQPQPGPLREARLTLPTIRGPIRVAFTHEPGRQFSLAVEIPVAVTAQIGLPRVRPDQHTLVVDGREIDTAVVGTALVVESVGSGPHSIHSR
jgi:hypothetical protein